MRALIVEDDAEVPDFLQRIVRGAAWAADGTPDGQRALAALDHGSCDLVILDVGLPEFDRYELCERIQARGDRTPVLMLTARTAVSDRVRGLDVGADDYLAKPFAVSELLARLRALARRPSVTLEPTLRLGDLELDPATHKVKRSCAKSCSPQGNLRCSNISCEARVAC